MKKTIFIYILSFVPLLCYGQIDISKAFEALKQAKAETSIIESAIMSELSIVRQQYRLARDGKTYGKNNKAYYGETYSLGIKISNGMILSDAVVEPWKNDADYNRLNKSGQYKPEPFWTYQRPLNDVDYHEVDLEFGTEYIRPVDAKGQLYLHEEKKGDFGLGIDDTAGQKSGYMVWISSTNLQDSAMSVNIKQNALTIVASEDSSRIAVDVSDDDKILGGLFVVPKYERGGRILLQLVGVAVPDETNGKWALNLLTKGAINRQSDATPAEVGDTSTSMEPTPIDSPTETTDKNAKKKNK